MIQSLSRASFLVEMVAAEGDGLTLTEIGERCDLNFRTVQGLLRSLKELGMLDLDPRGKRYRLGPAVALLMGSHSLSQILRPILADPIRTLAEELDQNVALATVDHGTLELVCNYDPTRPGTLGEAKQVDNPLSMCTGQLLLAYGESPVWRGTASQMISTLEMQIGADPATIHEQSARIRKQGWHQLELSRSEWQAVLAVPLSHQGKVFAALATHLRRGDPRGRNASAQRRWCIEHVEKLNAAAAAIAQRWQEVKPS